MKLKQIILLLWLFLALSLIPFGASAQKEKSTTDKILDGAQDSLDKLQKYVSGDDDDVDENTRPGSEFDEIEFDDPKDIRKRFESSKYVAEIVRPNCRGKAVIRKVMLEGPVGRKMAQLVRRMIVTAEREEACLLIFIIDVEEGDTNYALAIRSSITNATITTTAMIHRSGLSGSLR